MELFKYKDYNVIVAPEALLLNPIKDVLNKYKGKDKQLGIAELGYVYFFCDWASDYSNIIDLKERKAKILKDVYVREGSKLKIDKITDAAIEFYTERQQTLSMELKDSAKRAINKIIKYLDNVDLFERDVNGKYINDVSKVTSTIDKAPTLVERMADLDNAIRKEIAENSKLRGVDKKGLYES